MMTRVTEHEENPPDLGHDRQEERIDEEVSSMEEYLQIENGESLQVDIPQNITPDSQLNSNPSARHFQEYLGLQADNLGVWSRLDEEGNDVDHMVIHQPREGNWVTIEPFSSN